MSTGRSCPVPCGHACHDPSRPTAEGRHPAPRGRARRPLARAARHGASDRGPRLRLDLARRAPALSLARSRATRPVGGLDDDGGDRRGDVAGRVRSARRLHQLPQSGAARQAGGDDRRDQRRPPRPGPRAPAGTRPSSAAYGFPYDHRVDRFEEAFTIIRTLLQRGRDRLRRSLVPGPRLRAAAARPTSRRDRR